MISWLQVNKNTLLQVSVLLLFSFPLFGLKIPVIFIVLFGLISFSFHQNLVKNFNLILALFVLFPLLYLYQYFIDPTVESWFIFEKKIALIFVPIIFANLSKKSINYRIPMLASVVTTSLLIFVGLTAIVFNGISPQLMQSGISYAIRTSVESYLQIHPTYLSLLTLMSAAILIPSIIKNNTGLKNIWLYLILLIHLGFLLLLASRIALIGLLVLILFSGIYFRKSLGSKFKFIFLALGAILVAAWVIPSSHERITELYTTLTSNTQPTNGTNIRHSIYYCAQSTLHEHWLYGVGPGKLQQHLNSCYYLIYSYDIIGNNYNTHNEYLNVWLGLGLLGILIFIGLIGTSFFYAKHNYFHLAFLILFALFCLTENLLERQTGVLFFTIWNSYFMFYKSRTNDS